MEPEGAVEELFARVRAGDEAAAAELVRRYQPIIQSRVRFWLRRQDPRLRRLFDSLDVCQSVLGSFFYRAAQGQFDLDRPEQLAGLLVRMARHKLGHRLEHHYSQKRDVRRDAADHTLAAAPAAGAGPDSELADRELVEELRGRLTDEERGIADRRMAGAEWAAIAAELGGTPDGRRVQLARALDRVAGEMGLQ